MEKQKDTWNFVRFRLHCFNTICHRISIWETNTICTNFNILKSTNNTTNSLRYYVSTVIFLSWNSKQISPNDSRICIYRLKKITILFIYNIENVYLWINSTHISSKKRTLHRNFWINWRKGEYSFCLLNCKDLK